MMGYGDGYFCNVFEGMFVLINGCKVLIVGCVLMDMFMVDFGVDS